MVARGEWLGILDSDDVAMPSRFEEQIKLAVSDKDLVMIGSNSISIYKAGHVIKKHKYPTSHNDLINRLLSMRAFPPHSSMMYRKDVVQRFDGFNIRFPLSEDYDLWLRLSDAGKITSIDKSLVKIRKHDANISNWERGMLQIRLGVAAYICHFLRTHGYPDPSVTNDEARWGEFVTWIEKHLIDEGVFEKSKAWADARCEYFAAENSLIGTFRFSTSLIQSGHASVLAWEMFFGSSLPRRLAREWMLSTK
jgi:glycosyltransferase involved in cell wall biosynthesis